MATFPTREQVIEVIETHAPEKLKAPLRDNVAPAIALLLEKTADENIAIGQSKIGGVPDVPADFVWPTMEVETRFFFRKYFKKYPFNFIAQFDLSKLAAFDLNNELPSSGTLSFFYTEYSKPGKLFQYYGAARVFYWSGGAKLERRAHDEMKKRDFLPSHSMSYAAKWMCPDIEAAQINDVELDDTEFHQWNEVFREQMDAVFKDDSGHHLLGYAEAVQGEVVYSVYREITGDRGSHSESLKEYDARIKSEILKWRLLFQLNSHDSPNERRSEWMWGDAGKIYFCIQKEDLKARRFDKAVFEIQYT